MLVELNVRPWTLEVGRWVLDVEWGGESRFRRAIQRYLLPCATIDVPALRKLLRSPAVGRNA